MNEKKPGQDFVNQAIDLENEGEFERAEQVYSTAIQNHPENYILHSRLAALLVNLGRANEATASFKRARDLKPGDPDILFNSGLAHQSNGDFEVALELFNSALEKGFDKGMVFGSFAEIYEQTNRLDDLGELLEKALKETPGDVFLLFTAAKFRRREGNLEGALEILKTAEKLKDFDEIAMLACFERGRIYEKLEQPQSAFQAFQKGNLLSLKENILPGMNKKVFLEQVKAYKDLELSILAGEAAEPNSDPLETPAFLVGFPRSGTTLLHQILDGHPNLEVLEEEPFITAGRGAIAQGKGSLKAAFSNMSGAEWETLKNQLLAVYADLRTKGEDTKIIDKLPLHIIDVPLILKMFPKAKFIVALRHPFDCTLSCFMQNFNLNNAMLNFTNLDDTTRLYSEVFSLWLKYARELRPDFIYVRYEDVIEDLEQEARRMIDFLGLEWDPEVLNYRQQALLKKRINTPSYHQVIQPIYKDAAGRWRRYEKYFTPFRKRLVPFCEAFGYEL